MNRRKFVQQSALGAGSFLIMHDLFAKPKGKVYGYNQMQYTLDTEWSKADAALFPVNDCHEMVQDSKGRLIMLGDNIKNNILIF